MIAGWLDALWSRYPLTVRVVWQCLENLANGARFWRTTDAEIARELGISEASVARAVAILTRDRIIRCERYKRRPSMFTMLRSYPGGPPKRPDRRPPRPLPLFAEAEAPADLWSLPPAAPEPAPVSLFAAAIVVASAEAPDHQAVLPPTSASIMAELLPAEPVIQAEALAEPGELLPVAEMLPAEPELTQQNQVQPAELSLHAAETLLPPVDN